MWAIRALAPNMRTELLTVVPFDQPVRKDPGSIADEGPLDALVGSNMEYEGLCRQLGQQVTPLPSKAVAADAGPDMHVAATVTDRMQLAPASPTALRQVLARLGSAQHAERLVDACYDDPERRLSTSGVRIYYRDAQWRVVVRPTGAAGQRARFPEVEYEGRWVVDRVLSHRPGSPGRLVPTDTIVTHRLTFSNGLVVERAYIEGQAARARYAVHVPGYAALSALAELPWCAQEHPFARLACAPPPLEPSLSLAAKANDPFTNAYDSALQRQRTASALVASALLALETLPAPAVEARSDAAQPARDLAADFGTHHLNAARRAFPNAVAAYSGQGAVYISPTVQQASQIARVLGPARKDWCLYDLQVRPMFMQRV